MGVTDVRPLDKDAVVVLEELLGVEVVLSPPLSLLLIGGAMFFVLLVVKMKKSSSAQEIYSNGLTISRLEIAQQGTLTEGNTKPMTASQLVTANKVKFKYYPCRYS